MPNTTIETKPFDVHTLLENIYFYYLSLLPGLAIASLFFLELHPPAFIGTEYSPWWFFLGCIGFGAIAFYFVFPAEVLPFPTSIPAALQKIFFIPFQIGIIIWLTNQSLAAFFAINFCIEMIGALTGLLFVIFNKMRTDPNWFAFTVLFTIAIGGGAIAITTLSTVTTFTHWFFIGLVISIISIAFQTGRLLWHQKSFMQTRDGFLYILVGTFATFTFPLLAWLITYLLNN